MQTLLILTDWYSPAYLAGGPIQSIENIVSSLSKDINIYVYTSAFDLGINKVMDNVKHNVWVKLSDNAQVFYQSKKWGLYGEIKKLIKLVNPDVVYLNGMFSKHYVIDFLRLRRGLKHNYKIILAPRGMLKPSALSKKLIKKWLFLKWAGIIGLYNEIYFHATSKIEGNEILKYFPNANLFIISNLPPKISPNIISRQKRKSEIKLCFVGRIHPIKNLQFVYEILKYVKASVNLSIIGNPEDTIYARNCNNIQLSLPKNIKVTYLGGLPHSNINTVLLEHDLFILPTLGENYGHAIIESLSVGRPVVISNQTPWKKLVDYNAGWELPLSEKQDWIDTIEQAASWDQVEFDKHCQGAIDYARAHTNIEELVDQYKEMFSK